MAEEEDGGRWVSVALPVGIEEPLTYRVPEELGAPMIGARVLVPLGSRRLTGFVVDVPDEPALLGEDVEIRDVLRIVDVAPSITPPLMELARFVADYYACPLGEVLKAMHPGGPAGRVRARITEAGRLALGGAVRGARQHAVLAELDESGEQTSSSLHRRAGADPKVLRDLAARGWIELTESDVRETAALTITTWRLCPGVPLEPPVARRAAIGSAIRLHLAEHPEGRAIAEIAGDLGAEPSSVRAAVARLEKQGVACRAERLVERRPVAPSSDTRAVARLTGPQEQALGTITELVDAQRFEAVLIEGVTGSGKTEVYLRALARCVAQGRTGIYLVPEIAITPLLMRTVRARFGERTAILHSALSPGERHDERARIAAGRVDVVLGARSAIFAPMPRLGIVVVDEEHDGSYKQDSRPRYHGRDVAVMRGRIEGVPVVLGSATPSLESYWNATSGRYRLARLPERAGGSSPSTVELVDMRAEWKARQQAGPISRRLREALAATLAAGRQAIILLNRRGWSDFLLCRECGESEKCDRCAVTLTVHLRAGWLACHYCDAHRAIPDRCPRCQGTFLQNVGQGTEQVEAILGKLLPGVVVGRLNRDVARRKGAAAEVLGAFEEGRIRVLLGTQMIAKGHDFPGVTLVGVLQADRSLWLPDFRAAERTFQLLTQVAGRSGRRTEPGLVVVQTYSPEHPAIALAQTQDYPRFYEAEASARQALGYPPFRRLVGLIVSGEDSRATEGLAESLGSALRDEVGDLGKVLGPAAAPIARIKDRWRFQLLVKGTGRGVLHDAVRRAVRRMEPSGDLAIDVDVDPQSLM